MSYNRNRGNQGYHHRQHRQQPEPPVQESPIKYVQVDGLVLLKIIKHCHEEGTSSDAQGLLLGLVVDSRLEITNCFPFPRSNDDEETDDAVNMEYQYTMLRHMRNVNVDHLQVGWYQSNPFGSQLHRIETIDSQFMCQSAIEESVALFFDPVRTQRGFLSFKAYRLTNTAMEMCKDGEFKPETLRKNRMSFEKFFEEIPIIIKNSHLIKALLLEIEEGIPVDAGKQLLDIGGFTAVEKSLQNQIKSIEDLNKQSYTLRNQVLKHHEIARENQNRAQAKLPPMNEDEINKVMKQFKQTSLQRLDNLLNYSQTSNYCTQSSLYATQNIGKLFMAKAMQSDK